MSSRLFLTCFALTALLSSGCLFSKKAPKETENPSIPGAVEDSFRTRWIDKRVTELSAGGKMTPEAAREQATREYAQRYNFRGPSQNK